LNDPLLFDPTGCKTQYEWLSGNATESDTLENIDININTCIYILPNIPNTLINTLKTQIKNNNQWNDKTNIEKMLICSFLIDNDNIKNIINTDVNKPTLFNTICDKYTGINITIDWVRHAESCANQTRQLKTDTVAASLYSMYKVLKNSFYYEPNLSTKGMQQSVKFGTDYLNKNMHNIIICSALTRTIMTALIAFDNKNTTIYVVPYISEIQNAANTVYADYQNTAVRSDLLKTKIEIIKQWFTDNNLFQNTPTVNYDILRHFEKIYDETKMKNYNTTTHNIELFYTEVIPCIQKKLTFETNYSILCFTHGSLIRSICSKMANNYDDIKKSLEHDQLQNTTVIQQNINTNDFTITYSPDDTLAGINFTGDVCDVNSLKGMINGIISDKSTTDNDQGGGKYIKDYIYNKQKYLQLF